MESIQIFHMSTIINTAVEEFKVMGSKSYLYTSMSINI